MTPPDPGPRRRPGSARPGRCEAAHGESAPQTEPFEAEPFEAEPLETEPAGADLPGLARPETARPETARPEAARPETAQRATERHDALPALPVLPVHPVLPPGEEEALLATLRTALDHAEPLPDRVLAAARAAMDRRTPGALRIGLVRDSDVHDGAPIETGVRGGPRLLSFADDTPADPAGTGPKPTVEIEVTGTGPDRQLVGRLEPPVPARLRVRHRDGDHTTKVGAEGHFLLSGIPPGPISLVFGMPDGSSIVTSWVRI